MSHRVYRAARMLVALLALVLVAGACGEGQRVGNEKQLDFEEQANAQRLGEATPEPPPESAAPLSVTQQTPVPTPPPTPTPVPRYFEVSLVSDSPFYDPGNALLVAVGTTIRVTNRDANPDRPGRSFTDEAGAFDSGMLRAGAQWTMRFDAPGRFKIKDKGLPFASASLEVRAT